MRTHERIFSLSALWTGIFHKYYRKARVVSGLRDFNKPSEFDIKQ